VRQWISGLVDEWIRTGYSFSGCTKRLTH
jgi:hypothetical protein